MNITVLNGSPKRKNSNSLLLLQALEKEIPQNQFFRHNSSIIDMDSFIKNLSESEILVIAFPLYIDGLPSHLLSLLQTIEQSKVQSQATVYAIANCGFYEGSQTHLSLQMIEIFCNQCNLSWGYGVGVGAGEMLPAAPIKKGPNTSAGKALEVMAQDILAGISKENVYVNPNFPRFLYKQAGHLSWKKRAKENRIPVKSLRKTFYKG